MDVLYEIERKLEEFTNQDITVDYLEEDYDGNYSDENYCVLFYISDDEVFEDPVLGVRYSKKDEPILYDWENSAIEMNLGKEVTHKTYNQMVKFIRDALKRRDLLAE